MLIFISLLPISFSAVKFQYFTCIKCYSPFYCKHTYNDLKSTAYMNAGFPLCTVLE